MRSRIYFRSEAAEPRQLQTHRPSAVDEFPNAWAAHHTDLSEPTGPNRKQRRAKRRKRKGV